MLGCECHPGGSTEERQQRIAAAVSILDEHGPVAAYRAFRGDCKVPHLGPAFYSKILYFADAAVDHKPERVSALILDRTVAQKMIEVSHYYLRAYGVRSSEYDEAVRWVWDRADWSDHRYGIYCQWADCCSKYMHKTHSWPRSNDAIELALFMMPRL